MVVTLSLNWTHKHTYVLVRCHSWCSSGLCWRPCAKPRTSLWVWMLNFSNQHRCSLQKHTNTHLNEHVCVLMIYLSVQETQTHTLRNSDYIQLSKQYSFLFTNLFTKKQLQSLNTETQQTQVRDQKNISFLKSFSFTALETFIINKICFT